MASQSIVLRYRVQYFIITLIIGPSFWIGNVPNICIVDSQGQCNQSCFGRRERKKHPPRPIWSSELFCTYTFTRTRSHALLSWHSSYFHSSGSKKEHQNWIQKSNDNLLQSSESYEPFVRGLPYTEAKVDVTPEIEQRAQQAAQAGADHCSVLFPVLHPL